MIYVIDDGSTDGTGQVAAALGARVIRNASPAGYDSAIATGINRAFVDGATTVVTCDADGQHSAEDVARVAAAVMSGSADFATGLRGRYNRRVEALTGLVARAVFGTADPFCGLKCYGLALRLCVGDFPSKMHIGTLPLVWVRRNRLRAKFIPIAVLAREDDSRFACGLHADLRLFGAFLATLHELSSTKVKREVARHRARLDE